MEIQENNENPVDEQTHTDPFEPIRAQMRAYVDMLKKVSAHMEVTIEVEAGQVEMRLQSDSKIGIEDLVQYVKTTLDGFGINIIP